MVTGAVPGLGKSTLARRMAESLAEQGEGDSVELFKEEDTRSRPEFAGMMSSFTETGRATTDQMLDAATEYARACQASGSTTFVQDMLFPYTPSLLAWGHSDDQIVAFFADLAERCRPAELVQVHLVGDPARALRRAARREDEEWLDWLTAKVNGYDDVHGPVDDFDSLVRYFTDAQRRTTTLLEQAPWSFTVVDVDAP
jgi:hypothetical protein